MIFYCPNCWARVREDEKTCHECQKDIEPLDHRNYFEKLVNALNHSERTTRIRAAYILGEIGDKQAVKPLNNAIKKTEDLFLIEGIALALGKIGGEEVLPILIHLMQHKSFLVRRAALISLSKLKKREAAIVMKKALNDPSLSVQELARERFSRCKSGL